LCPRRSQPKWNPDDEPNLDWFHRPLNPTNPDRTASIKARRGNRPKSNWTISVSWFSNTPDSKNNRCQKNLGKAVRKFTFASNEDGTENSRFRQNPAFYGAFFISAFQF